MEKQIIQPVRIDPDFKKKRKYDKGPKQSISAEIDPNSDTGKIKLNLKHLDIELNLKKLPSIFKAAGLF